MVEEKSNRTKSGRYGTPLIKECHYSGPLDVTHVQLGDLKAGFLDQFPNRPVQMTPAGNPFPNWSEAILPSADSFFGRQPMLNEQ